MRDQLFNGRYRLLRQLGEGGMGQVWEARDETLDRPVAVKVVSLLSGGGSRGDEARARFLREARLTARLQHPNIVTIHDLGEAGDDESRIPFLVMELVRGEGLDATLRRGPVGLPDAARWGAQIGDALAEAHGMGVMHRDIKPSNVLITPSGVAKVLDFGVARAADPYATSDRLTRTGYIVGTPSYMAPEQARGHAEPRSDLYTLGCLLFELITGRLPFDAPDAVGYLSAHLTREPPAPSTLAPSVPAAWDDLVLTLLRKEPDQRYGNAADVAEALRRLDGAVDPAGPGDDRTPPRARPGTTAPLPPVDPTRQASEVSAPDAPPATPRPAYRKARVAVPALVLTAAVTAGAALLLADDADSHGDEDRSASQGSTRPPVGFTTIPDVCGALSKDALLGGLVEQPRPGEFSDKAGYRRCEWDTDELASVPVDGHVVVYAYRFGATGKARAHMEEEKGLKSLGGEAYVSLGMPGEIGDEAVIRVDKESVDKTVGGDVFHSFNSTSAAFRDSNLFIKIIYMRSRGDDPEENDRKTTRTGAEKIIKFLAATVENPA